MVIKKQLSDFSSQKNHIISCLQKKQDKGLFKQNLHDIFNTGRNKEKLRIKDVKGIIEAVENKLRKAEIIYYSFFGSDYDKSIIVNDTLLGSKIIETEFFHSTKTVKNRIEIVDPKMYKEIIDTNFQVFILTIASLQENIVRLIEILTKKKVVFGDSNPHLSTHLKILISYWDRLVDLGYRNEDDFFEWLNSHRDYINKYLGTINMLRNSFIHGYNLNLIKLDNRYVISKSDKKHDGLNSDFYSSTEIIKDDKLSELDVNNLLSELEVNNFVNNILTGTKLLTESLISLLVQKLSHHWTKVPI